MSQRNLENVKEVLFQYGREGMRVWCDQCGKGTAGQPRSI